MPEVVLLGDGPIVVVTSQHFAITGREYDEIVGTPTHYVSPAALRSRLKADDLVYVPHDLAEPVLPTEVEHLRNFDLYVEPNSSSWWARAHVPNVMAGGVGTAGWGSDPPDQKILLRGCCFPVNSCGWRMAAARSTSCPRSRRRSRRGIAVKLPDWPGLDSHAVAFERLGVSLIDPRLLAESSFGRCRSWTRPRHRRCSTMAAHSGHLPVCAMDEARRVKLSRFLGRVEVAVCDDPGFETTAVAAVSSGRLCRRSTRIDSWQRSRSG